VVAKKLDDEIGIDHACTSTELGCRPPFATVAEEIFCWQEG